MKVLMLNGSPKAGGNTGMALQEMEKVFIENGIDVDLITVGNQAVRGCVGCGGCHSRCPVGCIDATKKPLIIDNNRCIGCGACYLACPIRAVIKR